MQSAAALDAVIEAWLLDTAVINRSGGAAAAHAFFFTLIGNPHTRRAYFLALRAYCAWLERNEIERLGDVPPSRLAAYIAAIGPTRVADRERLAAKSRAQALAAIRRFHAHLIVGGVRLENPALNIKPPRIKDAYAPTPALTPEELGRVLESIPDDGPLGFRDRALIAFLAFTAARVGAALKLTPNAFYEEAGVLRVILEEKGDKRHSLPVSAGLERWLQPYLATLADDDPHGMVFRHWDRAASRLTRDPMRYIDAYRMVQRRVRDAGVVTAITPHGLRATAITAYLAAGGSLADAARLANHASTDTTRLYDRSNAQVGRETVDLLAYALRPRRT